MATPAYTTDLTDLVDLDTTGGTAVEPSSGWIAGRSPDEADTDFPIQGTVHASLTMNTTGKCGILVPGSTFTWTSGDYMFGWVIWLAPGAIATYAAGGLAILLGSSAADYDVHYVGGKDFGKYPYGGWQNFALDPERTPEEAFGTSPTAYHYVGAGANVLTAVAKGSPLGFDVFRYGRGELLINGGSSGDGYATFAGIAAINDNNSNRWGLFQAIPGGYQWKGLMSFGPTSLTEFVDSNKNIVIENTELVAADFNRIEINNASSVIDWTNISFSALGTVSKGEFEVIDNATVDMLSCVFTDMSTFIFQSNSTLSVCTWRRCALVTAGGASFDRCDFDRSTATIALNVANLSQVSFCHFISDGTGHAVELTSLGTGTMTWSSTHTGYASSDGSTGNETLYVNVGSGTLDLSIAAGADTPSIRTAGATVNIVSSVDLTMTVKDESGSVIVGAYAYIDDNDQTPFIMNTTTNGSGVATVPYSGSPVTGARWRVRKYGYKPFKQIIDIGSSDISIPVTLIADPQQS
jgi:hypothetical protein